MAKKVRVSITDNDGKEVTHFYSKTLTKAFNKLAEGTPVRWFCQENEFANQFIGDYVIKSLVNEPPDPPVTCPPGQHWDEDQSKCVEDEQPHECPPSQHWDDVHQVCVDDPQQPPTEPPTGDVLYDSTLHSNLHDKNVRTVTQEGDLKAGGLGMECRASGKPRIQVNDDGTFSLLCDAGHGRIYLYCLNYNAILEITCAFWNSAAGQDCSLKMRSRHNEGGTTTNRFGGYGLAVDRKGWDAKRELYHNVHDESKSGTLPETLQTQQYFTIRFTVKDDGNTVKQIGELNGKEFMTKIDPNPKDYMVDQASFDKQSYLWIRQNIDSGTGEIRIQKIRVLKA